MEKPNNSLRAAIFNAFEKTETKVSAEQVQILEDYLKDYMAQKFQLFMMPPGIPSDRDIIAHATAEMLWLQIMGVQLSGGKR